MNPLLFMILPRGGLLRDGGLSTQNCIIQSLASLPSLHSFTDGPEPAAAELRHLHEQIEKSESVDPTRLTNLLGLPDIEEGEGAVPYNFLLAVVEALPMLSKMTCSSTLVKGHRFPPRPVQWLYPTGNTSVQSLLATSGIRFDWLPDILIFAIDKIEVSHHLPNTILYKPLAIDCPVSLKVASTGSTIYKTRCYDLCATVQDHAFCKYSVAHVRQSKSNLWYRAHNQDIRMIEQEEVIDPNTWLLFYQARKD